MKFTIKRNDLIEAVNIVEKAVSIKSTMNILEGIHIEAKETEVTFTGNNLELCIICSRPALVSSKGSFVVKANLFSASAHKLPDTEEDVSIELLENNNVYMCCGNAKFNFSTADADEFPKPLYVEETSELVLKENILKSMLKQTVYAIAQTDIKPFLAGVYFELEDGILNVVGCDGYRLSIRREEVASIKNLKFIIPGRTAREVISILGETESEVFIKLSDKNARLELKNCTVITRLVEGNYLNYKGVAGAEKNLTVITETKNILNSIDRASLITSEAIKAQVMLKIENDFINVDCETVLGKVNDKISVNMAGVSTEIAFNPRYLLEAFKNIETNEIKIQFSGALNPITIEPIEGNKFCSIVLPVRIH